MVEFTEIKETESSPSLSPSQERLLDAKEIESLYYATDGPVKRPSVRAHLESLAKRIRRDALALKRMEDSKTRLEKEEEEGDAGTKETEEETEEVIVEEVETTATTAKPAPAAAAVVASASATASASTSTSTTPTPPPKRSPSQKYKTIDKFLFDAGSYNSLNVSIYITSLPSTIYSIPKENITCDFTSSSFDLKIHDPESTNNYRLLKDNLDKEINPDKSKLIIKKNKLIIKLAKVKSEYGSYENWTDLSSKKGKDSSASKNAGKSDPSASIMNMMKEMYDSGDDNMKKMIGETMLKQREGKLGDNKFGGAGGMGMDDLNM